MNDQLNPKFDASSFCQITVHSLKFGVPLRQYFDATVEQELPALLQQQLARLEELEGGQGDRIKLSTASSI